MLEVDIPGCPGYVAREDGAIRGPSGRWLKPLLHKYGNYHRFTPMVGGRQINMRWHVAICLAFHGPRPEGMEVRHLNGMNRDNRASNLRWGTHAQNMADLRLHNLLRKLSAPLPGA